jgi:diaminopimelate decarboxylase/aspartate kinase
MALEHPRWIVLKFGGTSVSTAANWATIANVVCARMEAGYRPLVVHSALSGVTRSLELLASSALSKEHADVLAGIDARHDELAAGLGLSAEEGTSVLGPDRQELRELVEGVALVGELTPRTRARMLAFGERMATRLGAEYLRRRGMAVTWLDARDLLTSVDRGYGAEASAYLSAECDPAAEPGLAARLSQVEGVPLTQGFTARNPGGETVVLGRGGADTPPPQFTG